MADKKATEGLPAWAQKLARAYFSRTVCTFLLHGAVRDLHPLGGDGRDGSSGGDRGGTKPGYGPLNAFLAQELFAGRDHILSYNRSSGIRALDGKSLVDVSKTMAGYDAVHGTSYSNTLPKEPGKALGLLETFMRLRIGERKSVALVVDFAETLVPASDGASLSAEDRFLLVTLLRWAADPQFLAADVSIVLVSESLADISSRLVKNPYVAAVELSLPDEEERRRFLKHKLAGRKMAALSEVGLDAFVKLSSGLSCLHLERLFSLAESRSKRISLAALKEAKKEAIAAQCQGLLEFVEPPFGLDAVAGHEAAKAMLQGTADALKKGQTGVLPMGYLVSGPVGTGKTFLVTCFAGEVGIPCVKFLNFRSQWQGVTEGNLERIFGVLKALWPVAVVVDEADAFLGNRDATGDSGTSSRVFASMASFMGDTQYRGKIIWFLLTCRPDKLPIDLKRQGRAEEHLALFHPQTAGEKNALYAAMCKKLKLDIEVEDFAELCRDKTFSGADIEALLVRAQFLAATEGRPKVNQADLLVVLEDFIPPSYPLEMELQNLVAVQECTRRSLLPPAYADMDRSQLATRIQNLRLLLGE
jgi:SpoVK/Ycf46/Vps4 family AAA+-type ATPase